MSHVTSIDTKIRDLAALRVAVSEMGAIFIEGQSTYTWYGRHVGDYPLPPDLTKADLGKCHHAIRLPGVNYEIGVRRVSDGYTLLYDFYGYPGSPHDGHRLKKHFGDNLGRLTQLYAVHKATMIAKAKGYAVRRMSPLVDGTIKLTVMCQ